MTNTAATLAAYGFPSSNKTVEASRSRNGASAPHHRPETGRNGSASHPQSVERFHQVSLDGNVYCTCPDFNLTRRSCRHLYEIELALLTKNAPKRSLVDGGVDEQKRTTDWPAYNAYQSFERDHFAILLRNLCDMAPEPPPGIGRPRIPASDMLYGMMMKVYTGKSTRRSLSYLRDSQSKGLMGKVPSASSAHRYLANPDLAPLLYSLIRRSSLPLAAVEKDLAVDATGFSTSVYNSWNDHKWGRKRKLLKKRRESMWLKAHIVCGVFTKVVTAIKVTEPSAQDAPYLPELVERSAENFDIREISADKGYLSRKNFHAIEAHGATPYIPFKSNSRARAFRQNADPLWERLFHYYSLNRDEFNAHYHKRSNVESALRHDQEEVWRLLGVQGLRRAGQRSAGQVPVPQHQRLDTFHLRSGDRCRFQRARSGRRAGRGRWGRSLVERRHAAEPGRADRAVD